MTSKRSTNTDQAAAAEWPLSPAATLGSYTRVKGIEREIRANLPWAMRKHVKAEAGRIALSIPEAEVAEFQNISAKISKTLEGIEDLPVLPREVEDILTILSRERHKWTKDGRLQSIGTRTVKLRGRARKVTFHVFHPRHIEDVLDRDLATMWREDDAQQVAENRRRAAGKAALTRAGTNASKGQTRAAERPKDKAGTPDLAGWDAFDAEGLLR